MNITVRQQLSSLIQQVKKSGRTYYELAKLLSHSSEVCKQSQDSISKMIFSEIDSSEQNLVAASANCYTLFSKFVNPNWIDNQLLLCNCLHIIMDELFSEVEFTSTDKSKYADAENYLPKFSEENVHEYYRGLESRFINLNVFLSTMLRGCGENNSVCLTDILKLLCRGLAITPFNFKKEESVKKQMLVSMLPRLHVSLLTTLSALIEGFKEELLPFTYSILKLIHQTVEWTEKLSDNHETLSQSPSVRDLRLCAYKTLNMWLTYTGSLSGVETVSKDFLQFILADVKVLKNTLHLTIQKTGRNCKNPAKKFKSNQNGNTCSEDSTPETRNLYLNSDLCEEALISLQNILYSGDCWLNVAFYEKVKIEIVGSLQELYLEASESNVYKAKSNCRLQLIRTLKALQMNPLTQPPTQFSIEIFNMALMDTDAEVIKEAKLGLAIMEKIVHPSAPTLNFPYPVKSLNSEEIHEVDSGISLNTGKE